MSEDKVNYLHIQDLWNCPNCGHNEFHTYGQHWLSNPNKYISYKECDNCGFRQIEYETTLTTTHADYKIIPPKYD